MLSNATVRYAILFGLPLVCITRGGCNLLCGGGDAGGIDSHRRWVPLQEGYPRKLVDPKQPKAYINLNGKQNVPQVVPRSPTSTIPIK